MATIINDLKDENDKLRQELEQSRGEQQTSEDEIQNLRRKVEEEFRAKLDYKETELADVNTKLGRISQSNMDLKMKCDRLE